jgi:hypothetical protein
MIKAGQRRRFETEQSQEEKLNSVDVSRGEHLTGVGRGAVLMGSW